MSVPWAREGSGWAVMGRQEGGLVIHSLDYLLKRLLSKYCVHTLGMRLISIPASGRLAR